MKTEVESLSERLRVEQDGRTSADKDLGRAARCRSAARPQNLAARRFRCARSARSPAAAARAAPGARDDIRSRVEDVLVRLAHDAQELRSDKTDRKALAALLTEMAMRLNGDEIHALAPGDEVRV